MKTKMTKAELEAYKARVRDYVAQGIDKEMAKVMARVDIAYGLIAPVVR